MTSTKRERGHYKLKREVEKVKRRVASLAIEEEKYLRAWYQVQSKNKGEARKLAESNMKGYLDKINALKKQASFMQVELET